MATLPPGQRKIAQALRRLVRETVPSATETVLWRSLSYHRPELRGRIKGAVCLITPKHTCVNLEFIHGARLPDPRRLLRGSGREKRFVQLYEEQTVDWVSLREFVVKAARYEPGRV
ncbi:DUF1801 domain-containing protein [Opitutus terrae]|uniref:DUF1801 domain-containing protein n=1 Tax=Opitutus terrae TaxID=107709 RepID=UPI0013053A0C|nr:DUF1801 domain-containing protein [Opitutus terrae]